MKLFISYSRDDKTWVYDLANQLKDNPDDTVWIDRLLVGADDWWTSILGAIESADCLIYIMSPKSVNSIFCDAEVSYALALNKPVLPLYYQVCEIPDVLSSHQIQYEDVSNVDPSDNNALDHVVNIVERALNRIDRRLGRNEFPAPNPAPSRPNVPQAQKSEQALELFQAMDETLLAGNFSLAENLCAQIVQVDPQFLGLAAQDRLTSAKQASTAGSIPESVNAYGEIASLVAANDEAGAQAAWRAYKGKYGTKYDPNDYSTHLGDGRSQGAGGSDPDMVNGTSPLSEQTTPMTAQQYFERGLGNQYKGDHDSAIADFTEAIQLKPTHADAYYNRAAARAAKSDYDGAIGDYTEVIQIDPDYAYAYYDRAVQYAAKNDYARAVIDGQKFLDLMPNDETWSTKMSTLIEAWQLGHPG